MPSPRRLPRSSSTSTSLTAGMRAIDGLDGSAVGEAVLRDAGASAVLATLNEFELPF